jgi:predicted nuclease of predicted toxin-antitoxin system
MERIKFYFDEHVPQAVADGLRRRGVDVLVVQDTGRRGAPDDEQLAFASQQGRVMVTMDSDYLILACASPKLDSSVFSTTSPVFLPTKIFEIKI